MFQSLTGASVCLFNQNISGWNVSNVTNMSSMFFQASNFNNGDATNIESKPLTWSAPKCTTFASMFQSATKFNQSLPNLVDTSGVVSCTLASMFNGATIFNQNIGGWNTVNVTSMINMFTTATAFNQPIGNWDVSNVTNMFQMFFDTNSFNQNISLWKTGNVTNMGDMFRATSTNVFNQPINTSGTSWDVSKVTNMAGMFRNCTVFNQYISNWNVSNVTTMLSMFIGAANFNNGDTTNISSKPLTWSAPKCTTFLQMFQSAINFNQALPNLVNTSGVASCTLASMFQGARSFNQNIGSWDTSNVTSMASMFLGSTSLSTTTIFNNGETGLTSIANITPSTSSYTNATKVLNCPGATFLSTLSIGDVLIIQTTTIVYSSSIQSITDNTNLVLTTAYGSNITVGTITSINKQIAGTSPLNWNTSKVTTMANMFQYCLFFNQNITTSGSNWNTNLVTTVVSLFQGSSTALITLFNNGEIIIGTTAPMGWTFNVAPTSTNYRLNCRLTTSNKPASLA
jgi:surface protein